MNFKFTGKGHPFLFSLMSHHFLLTAKLDLLTRPAFSGKIILVKNKCMQKPRMTHKERCPRTAITERDVSIFMGTV